MAEDWEEKMLEQMAEMFRNMGMSVDINQLKAMMKQFQSKFESMGIDPERLAKGDVNFNFDILTSPNFSNLGSRLTKCCPI